MSTAESLIVILPKEMAELVRRKVQSGAYETPSAVIEESLREMQQRDDGLEQWLREEVVPGHAEYLADPAKAVPVEDVLARIEARASKMGR